jgi:DNA-binding Xre family transcriptional regulator
MPENREVAKVKWKLKDFLEKHGKTPYALWKESGLSRTAVYDICNDKQDGLRFEAMGKIVTALETLTGVTVTPNDLLEVVRETP